MKGKWQLVMAASAVLLVSCARADEDVDTTAGDTAAFAPTTVPAPADTAAARTVHVVLNEWRVAPSETTIPAGRVQFHVMNEGQYQHALEVERGTDHWETAPIAVGGTGTVTVDLTPGTYTLYCPVVDSQGNHRQRGMQTTVTVN